MIINFVQILRTTLTFLILSRNPGQPAYSATDVSKFCPDTRDNPDVLNSVRIPRTTLVVLLLTCLNSVRILLQLYTVNKPTHSRVSTCILMPSERQWHREGLAMQPFEFESHLLSSVIIRGDVVNCMRRREITQCVSLLNDNHNEDRLRVVRGEGESDRGMERVA
jgi:hypothetical protein